MSKSEYSADDNLATMDETAPLTVATPIYGGTEPETVTFDERTVPQATAMPANNGNRYEEMPMIRPAGSADQSISFSQASEEPVFRDVPFAICFWIQLTIVVVFGCTIAPKGYGMLNFDKIKNEIKNDPTTSDSDFEQFEEFISFLTAYVRIYPQRLLLYLLAPTGIIAFSIALFITTKIVRPFPRFMVTACLVGAFVDTAILMVFACVQSQSVAMLLLSCGILCVVAYYIWTAWRLIPYSAVNLGVALEGIKSNCGIYILAFILANIGFFWIFYWFYTLMGVMIFIGETQCPNSDSRSDPDSDCPPQGWMFFFLLLSFYWTVQVIINTIHVTVAGVLATWCYDYDEAQHCCSPAVWSSLYRSLTFSFGSICFGSLLQAIIAFLRYLVENARRHRDNRRSDGCDGGEMLLCCLDCLIRCFEDILDYFNHWAFVFCAIYGESYLTSGKMVIELFKARGWTTIITDDLVGYVLGFTTFSVGVLTGICSMILQMIVDSSIQLDAREAEAKQAVSPQIAEGWENSKSFLFGPLPRPGLWALGIGFVIGLLVCSVMMSVVRGAVNTLIVCWADSPSRLEANHPNETKEMAEAWTTVFPQAGVQRVNTTGVLPVDLPQQQTSHPPTWEAYTDRVL